MHIDRKHFFSAVVASAITAEAAGCEGDRTQQPPQQETQSTNRREDSVAQNTAPLKPAPAVEQERVPEVAQVGPTAE